MAEAVKVKDWQSSFIWVIGLIFICGMTYNTVNRLQDDVSTNTEDIKLNTEKIHKNELVQTEINAKLEDIPEIKTQMNKLTDYLMQFDYNKKKDE